jgi:hypothetical protein
MNCDLWALVWEPLRSQPGWEVQWIPSHNSLEEAFAAGMSNDDWHGNFFADEAAKAEARARDLSQGLLEQWSDRQAANEAVWRLIANSQVAHLAERPRRHDGAAAKARKRKAPARPNRRVRTRIAGGAVEPGARAPLPAAIAKATAAAKAAAKAAAAARALGPVVADGSAVAAPEAAEDQKPAADAAVQLPVADPAAPVALAGIVVEAALAFVGPVIPAVAGIHDMQVEAGPGGPAGWAKNAAGTLVCKWACARCGKKAGNSSRLMELLRRLLGS